MTEDRAARARRAADERRELAESGLPDGTPAVSGEVVQRPPDVMRQLMEAFKPEIKAALPGLIKPEAFVRMALTGLKSSKQAYQLQRCDRPSLFAALLESARYGLMPFTDEAAIVPFGTTATFIPMAGGFAQMFMRTGQIVSVNARLIYQGDDWELEYGTGGHFYHKPRYVDEQGQPVSRGEPILAYCYLTRKDGSITEVTIVNRDEAEETMRKRSRAWQYAESSGKRDSTWHTDFDAMWTKTALRRHAKYAPKSPELVELLLVEARDDTRRPDAAPVMAAPVERVEGVDWSVDVHGGKIAEGTVEVDADGVPWAGDAQKPAAPAGPPAGTDPAPGYMLREVDGLFAQCGWGGPANRPRRLVAAAVLRTERDGTARRLEQMEGLTVDEAQRVSTRLSRMIIQNKDQAGRRVALQALYDGIQREWSGGQDQDQGQGQGQAAGGDQAGDQAGAEPGPVQAHPAHRRAAQRQVHRHQVDRGGPQARPAAGHGDPGPAQGPARRAELDQRPVRGRGPAGPA